MLLKIGLFLSALFVVGATVWVVQQQRVQAETLPVYGSLEAFQLVSQDNTVFDSQALKGRISIVNFIFTSCPEVCPLLTRQMAKIQEKTKAYDSRVQLISISVDPNTDTPEKLKKYGTKFGADFRRWTFLTGPIESIRKVVVKGFMNAMGEKTGESQSEPDLFEITHGENFVILDSRGEIRAFRQAKSDRDINGIIKIVHQLDGEGRGTTKTASWNGHLSPAVSN